MDQATAIAVFGALAHPTRLAVFRLLVQHAPEGMPALTIGDRIGVIPSTLSGHFTVLRRAGLVTSTRHKREVRYAANMASIAGLIDFVLSDCCGGRVENCDNILSMLGRSMCNTDLTGALPRGARCLTSQPAAIGKRRAT